MKRDMEVVGFEYFKKANAGHIHLYLKENIIDKYVRYDLDEETESLYKSVVMYPDDPRYKDFIIEKDVGRDFVGNLVRPGDSVVYIKPRVRSLVSGKVISCTPGGFQVQDEYSDRSVFRDSSYVVKFEKEN